MNEVLACRTCHHTLTSDAGCAMCLPVKPHLIVQSTVDEDAVPLATVAGEAVSLLRRQLTYLKNQAKIAGATYNPIHAAEARAVAGTLSKLLDSARKVVQDGADAVSSMSFQERATLFLEWTGSLPGAYRRKIIAQLIEQNQAKLESVDQTQDLPSETRATN